MALKINFNKKNIVFLMSFGHCGIDWLHSLLDSHKQILIMPCFSFYRTWKLLDASSIKTIKDMHRLWCDHFTSQKMQNKETKQFQTTNEENIFITKFHDFLHNQGISRKETFRAILQSYAYAKNIDLNNIRVIIEHEHISFPYREIFNDFTNPNILMIYRDPRASIAGYYKGINKKYDPWPDLYEYFINMSLEEWLNSWDLYKMYKSEKNKRLFLVKNENLSENTREIMEGVANWLEIDYNDSLIKSTYPNGLNWIPDSSYISKEQYDSSENFSEKINNFFDPEEIRKRWMSVLQDNRDIIMIEFLLKDFMKEFGYKRINPDTLLMRLKGLLYFLLPHRGCSHFKYYSADQNELERVKERINILNKSKTLVLWDLFPSKIQSYLINLNAIINHLIIYFKPGVRWIRYDNPKLNLSYRNVRGS